MNRGKYVFAQILSLVNRYEFQKCVDRYNGDYGTGKLNCWNLFAQLFFGQLTGRKGLRDICLCLEAHSNRLYHLGIRQSVHQSSLSRANENRDWRIFADFGKYLIHVVVPMYASDANKVKDVDREIFALDSTTISVSIVLMEWAKGKYSRGAVKMHTVLDLRGNIPTFIHVTDGKYHDVNALDEIEPCPDAIYIMDKAYIDFLRLYKLHKHNAFFVVRAKSNLRFKAVSSTKVDKTSGLRCDQKIRLLVAKSRKQYPGKIRRIKYYDKQKHLTLVLLTNELELRPLDIAAIYKERWQIEVFFKWVKQNLEIKKPWGHSPNAIKIQLWMAINTYLTVALLKKQLKSKYSIYEMIQILSISTFDKTPVKELFTENKINQDFKEQPNLFNNS